MHTHTYINATTEINGFKATLEVLDHYTTIADFKFLVRTLDMPSLTPTTFGEWQARTNFILFLYYHVNLNWSPVTTNRSTHKLSLGGKP